MTVAADLATAHGALRRYFLKIDGLPYTLNQRVAGPDGTDTPVAGTRSAVTWHPSDADLIARYSMDETGATDDAADSSGSGHTAVHYGGDNLSTTGRFGGARDIWSDIWHADERLFYVTDRAAFRPTAVTLCAWIKVAELGIVRPVGKWAGSWVDTNLSWGLLLDYSAPNYYWKARIHTGTGTRHDLMGGAAVTVTGKLVHVGMTYGETSRTLRLYVAGTLVAEWYNTDASAVINYSSNHFCVGEWAHTHHNEIDDVAIYSTEKDAAWFADRVLGGNLGLNCLHVPEQEISLSLDLGTMQTQASAMTFHLDDIEDPADG